MFSHTDVVIAGGLSYSQQTSRQAADAVAALVVRPHRQRRGEAGERPEKAGRLAAVIEGGAALDLSGFGHG